MQLKTFILHFILGGTIVSVVTFLGSQGKGMLAAFVATFPTMTALTFALLYNKAGQVATINYAKGLLFMMPPWIIHVLCLIFLLPRWGFVKSLTVGVLTYMILAGCCQCCCKAFWTWMRRTGDVLPELIRMSITLDFIRNEIEKQSYEISLHADKE